MMTHVISWWVVAERDLQQLPSVIKPPRVSVVRIRDSMNSLSKPKWIQSKDMMT